MDYKIKINGIEYEVSIHKFENTTAQLTVNEVDYEVEIESLNAIPTQMNHRPAPKVVAPDIPLEIPKTSRTAYELKSPLPGIILDITVKEGDTVRSGQQVLILEAMKMENGIHTERDGVVKKINCKKGDSVLEGDVLLIIQ